MPRDHQGDRDHLRRHFGFPEIARFDRVTATLAAMERSPETANSRPMIRITIQAGTR